MSCIFFGGACLKYNNLPLGPIQPWSPSTKELHEYTRWHLICFQCGKGGGELSRLHPPKICSLKLFLETDPKFLGIWFSQNGMKVIIAFDALNVFIILEHLSCIFGSFLNIFPLFWSLFFHYFCSVRFQFFDRNNFLHSQRIELGVAPNGAVY